MTFLAEDPDLGIRQLQIFESESEGLVGAQPIQQQQANQSEIAKATKAAPELGYLVGG
jgi:hypothetical protein